VVLCALNIFGDNHFVEENMAYIIFGNATSELVFGAIFADSSPEVDL